MRGSVSVTRVRACLRNTCSQMLCAMIQFNRALILRPFLLAVFLLFCGLIVPVNVSADSSTTYTFRVYLGEKPIGTQEFRVLSEGGATRVDIDARFDVKVLFLTVYSYRHSNHEEWEDGCLRKIKSTTQDGGEEFFVNGYYKEGNFYVENRSGALQVTDCVRTYPYWNPSLLRGNELLNSQTGEVDKVQITEQGEETILVRGVSTRTSRRRILSKDFTIDLWYTERGKWVALESEARDGNLLRYMIQ